MTRKAPIRPIAREADLVIQEVDGEVLVYDLNTNKASCLNETAASVWRHCNGQNDVSDIAAALRISADVQVDDELVWLAIDQLKRSQLIEDAPELPVSLARLTRRELAKHIAMTSMIALPLVATLVAPRAVHANSACIVGGICTCSENSMGTGTICDTSAPGGVPCADVNCRCAWENNGNMNGTCVV